jgi:hypothetical protein
MTTKPPPASFTTWKFTPFVVAHVRAESTDRPSRHPRAGSDLSQFPAAVRAWSHVTGAAHSDAKAVATTAQSKPLWMFTFM